MKTKKALYRCSFDSLLKWKGKNNERWEPAHFDLHVISDGDATKAGTKAVKLARKKLKTSGFPRIKDFHLRSINFVSHVDG